MLVDVPALRQGEDNTLPVDGNVRDRMLRQPGESIQVSARPSVASVLKLFCAEVKVVQPILTT